MNYPQKSSTHTEYYSFIYFYYYSPHEDFTHGPQDDIGQEQFIEENFNDEDFQTTG